MSSSAEDESVLEWRRECERQVALFRILLVCGLCKRCLQREMREQLTHVTLPARGGAAAEGASARARVRGSVTRSAVEA